MKRKILWGIVASIISLSLAACSDDNDDAMDYYVRYTVGATAGDDFFISYNDKKGEPHIDQQKKRRRNGGNRHRPRTAGIQSRAFRIGEWRTCSCIFANRRELQG